VNRGTGPRLGEARRPAAACSDGDDTVASARPDATVPADSSSAGEPLTSTVPVAPPAAVPSCDTGVPNEAPAEWYDNDLACTDDANPTAYVVALQRDRLPAGPFVVQLGPQDPPGGAPRNAHWWRAT
jgi:hypothetical protein